MLAILDPKFPLMTIYKCEARRINSDIVEVKCELEEKELWFRVYPRAIRYHMEEEEETQKLLKERALVLVLLEETHFFPKRKSIPPERRLRCLL